LHGGATGLSQSEDLLAAVLEFQHWLAVPESGRAPGDAQSMQQSFNVLGCAVCHRPNLPVVFEDGAGRQTQGTIAPYTDLLVHHLGAGLADVDISGRVAATKWRTAPLWGVGYISRAGRQPTLLHDGRARTIEEAILWHDGEALTARQNFEHLSAADRRQLLDWIATL
jgi:CxxC motif-containing protein (DUF1111 family)